MSEFYKSNRYNASEETRVFSVRLNKRLNARFGRACNAAWPHLKLARVFQMLLTHALDDLESRNGDSQELTEIRSAIAKSKTGIGPKGRLNEKLNASLGRLERVSKR